MDMNETSKNGIVFEDTLLLIFITLKLTRIIDWSWWWVLSPLWITAVIALMFVILERILNE